MRLSAHLLRRSDRTGAVVGGLLALAFVGGCSDDDAAGNPTAAFAEPHVVRVSADGCLGLARVIGTGFSVGTDTFVTNAHVVRGATSVFVSEAGEPTDAGRVTQVVAIDVRADLALLSSSAQPATIPAAVGRLSVGDEVRTLVLRNSRVTDLDGEVETVIRADVEEPADDTRYLREAGTIGSPITSGDSGAPVIDSAGRVVGVMFADSRNREGRAYAVNGSELIRFLADQPAPSVDGPDRRCS